VSIAPDARSGRTKTENCPNLVRIFKFAPSLGENIKERKNGEWVKAGGMSLFLQHFYFSVFRPRRLRSLAWNLLSFPGVLVARHLLVPHHYHPYIYPGDTHGNDSRRSLKNGQGQ
jgi:hypothetical protein